MTAWGDFVVIDMKISERRGILRGKSYLEYISASSDLSDCHVSARAEIVAFAIG